MQKFFRIRPIQWALYAGGYIILLAATIIGLNLDSINNDDKRLLIIGFAACVIFLFFIFFSFLKKTLVMPRLLFALFVINNAALLTVGLGIIPILLYEQALVDNKGFFPFSPTSVIALVIASATVFFCYWLYSGILSWCCRFRGKLIFSKIRDAAKQNISFIVCVGIIVLFLLVVSWFLFGGFDGILFLLGLLVVPFALYIFPIIANQNAAILAALLIFASIIAYWFLLCKSSNYEKTANKQEFFSSVILCSRHVFIVHLIFWAVYMKLFGIVFEFGSWNPFQVL